MITRMAAFEDFAVGKRFDLGRKKVTADEIVAFASEFDPQPMHLDEEAGKASLLGGLAASGWHICAMFMRMMYDAYLDGSTSQGSPGLDYVRWKKPVLAGDVLTGRSEVVSARISGSRPELGLVTMRHELFNQKGEMVAELQHVGMMLRRDGEARP